jgi:alpha-1,3-glucosyltransferase
MLSQAKHPIVTIVLISVLIRVGIGFSGYSGITDPITKGDFEAHRNWMNITSTHPIKEWYSVSEEHWKLDYPPACAYLHLGMSYIVKYFHPIALQSKSYEDASLKYMMRAMVIVLDMVVYFSSVIMLCKFYFKENLEKQICCIFLGLNIPSLLLIDHGHFHFNSVMIGLSMWAFYFIETERIGLAIVFYVLSVNFKQMSIYYGMPLLVQAIMTIYDKSKREKSKLFYLTTKVIQYGATTVFSFLMIWSPYIISGRWQQVIKRIFPIKRGLWEDKVSNFWLFANLFVKIRTVASENILALMSISIIATILLGLAILWLYKKNIKFMHAEFICSMTFFLFAFQVHEKTLLLPLVPFSLLMTDFTPIYSTMMLASSFSMYNLLRRDGCTYAYYLMQVFCLAIIEPMIHHSQNTKYNYRGNVLPKFMLNIIHDISAYLPYLVAAIIAAFHLLEWLYPNPLIKFPDFWYVINIEFCFLIFALIYIYSWANILVEDEATQTQLKYKQE